MIYEYAYRKAFPAQEQVTSYPSREALVLHTSSGYKLAKSLGSVLRTPFLVLRIIPDGQLQLYSDCYLGPYAVLILIVEG